MSTSKQRRRLLPPWDMPSDPIKALWWFMHWLLKVVVHYFWLLIIFMVIYETVIDWMASGAVSGLISGFVTLLIGLVVWAILRGVLVLVNFSTGVSRVYTTFTNLQQQRYPRRDFSSPFNSGNYFSNDDSPFAYKDPESKIVEGTITDLEEERQKRRREEK
ncbi:hypothetical protein [Tengunoibacter tsumagoiensis]|uniref:DUF4282 domain-containing protein n=1 Tax=Tengunoibacter tsumagoiensis TaxID=2014871 RepID=A0A402A2B5_9CHLR|nr:hypothetical protein [Tengunoibacter tsumagoiensis]GCE13202.1 hypothetical protein KTT_30610 [Tengunoibacter tsumagoiensis]